jgi:hypothetical protein
MTDNKANNQIVPNTELRSFYRTLSKMSFSTSTQLALLTDLNRKDNYDHLVKMYENSFYHIKRIYNNDEPIIGDSSKRKSLPVPGTKIKKTNELVSLLSDKINITHDTDPSYNFKYIDREIAPLRTTSAKFDTGKSAKSSGNGGIDFIGWNTANELPILGEIKINNDQNPFYAIIQLLTYLSEISTPSQIARCNTHKLFNGKQLTIDQEFYLYVVLHNYRIENNSLKNILELSRNLAQNITVKIAQVKEIKFFTYKPDKKQITDV